MNDTSSVTGVLERFPYGVYVVAVSSSPHELTAIIATWVTQVSFSPPMVAVSLETGGTLARELVPSTLFSLSSVSDNGLSSAKAVLKTGPRFSTDVAHPLFAESPSGVPIFLDSIGVLECRVVGLHEAGDHHVVVAEVVRAASAGPGEPLTLKQTGWKYRKKRTASTS